MIRWNFLAFGNLGYHNIEIIHSMKKSYHGYKWDAIHSMYDSTFVYTPGAPAPQFFFPNETMPNKKEGDSLSFLASRGAPESPLQESWSVIHVELNCKKLYKKTVIHVRHYYIFLRMHTYLHLPHTDVYPPRDCIDKKALVCKLQDPPLVLWFYSI